MKNGSHRINAEYKRCMGFCPGWGIFEDMFDRVDVENKYNDDDKAAQREDCNAGDVDG